MNSAGSKAVERSRKGVWVETSEGADGQMVMGRESGGGGIAVLEGHQGRLCCGTKEAPGRGV